jgi:hypothetical protein
MATGGAGWPLGRFQVVRLGGAAEGGQVHDGAAEAGGLGGEANGVTFDRALQGGTHGGGVRGLELQVQLAH